MLSLSRSTCVVWLLVVVVVVMLFLVVFLRLCEPGINGLDNKRLGYNMYTDDDDDDDIRKITSGLPFAAAFLQFADRNLQKLQCLQTNSLNI